MKLGCLGTLGQKDPTKEKREDEQIKRKKKQMRVQIASDTAGD